MVNIKNIQIADMGWIVREGMFAKLMTGPSKDIIMAQLYPSPLYSPRPFSPMDFVGRGVSVIIEV